MLLLSLAGQAQDTTLGSAREAPARSETGSATGLPDLGDGVELSLGAERRLGDGIVRQLFRDKDYVDDPVILAYVQGIWQTLITAARARGEMSSALQDAFAWQVLLGKDRSVNAFALPGGYFGLHLGLVAVVESRDELASVMAHELSHVTQRHIARSMARQKELAPWMVGAAIVGLLAASKDPRTASVVLTGAQAAGVQTQLNFSRDMEREADRVGFAVMSQAGYAPQGFVSMFEKLQQSNRLNDAGGFPYLRSHPLSTERIADMQGRVQDATDTTGTQPSLTPLSTPSTPRKRPMLLEHAMVVARAQILTDTSVENLRRWAAVPDATTPSMMADNPAGGWYGRAFAALKQRDFALAHKSLLRLNPLVAQDPAASVLARLLAAELALAQNQVTLASEQLKGMAKTSRPALLLSAQADTQNGRAAQAAQDLQTWLVDHPRDAMAWQTLASAYEAQGRALAAIRAQAEYSVAELDYEAALYRLQAAQELARKKPANDSMEAAIVDTRMREVRSLMQEQAQQP
jgi:predicted Zn-dependent protease